MTVLFSVALEQGRGRDRGLERDRAADLVGSVLRMASSPGGGSVGVGAGGLAHATAPAARRGWEAAG